MKIRLITQVSHLIKDSLTLRHTELVSASKHFQ